MLLWQIYFPEIQTLLCFFEESCGVRCPWEAFRDVCAKEFEAGHLFHPLSLLMHSGVWTSPFFLKSVMSSFVCFDVEALVFCGPVCKQTPSLLWSAAGPIVFTLSTRLILCCVLISKGAYLMYNNEWSNHERQDPAKYHTNYLCQLHMFPRWCTDTCDIHMGRNSSDRYILIPFCCSSTHFR